MSQSPEGSNSMESLMVGCKNTAEVCFSRPKALTQWNKRKEFGIQIF